MTDRKELALPSFWTVQVIGWLGLYVLILLTVFPDFEHKPIVIWNNALKVGCWLLASGLLRPVCRALLRRPVSWFRLELEAFTVSALLGTVAMVLGTFLVTHVRGYPRMNWNGVLRDSVQSTLILFFWCSLYFGVKQWRQSVQERERRLTAEGELRDTRLRALRYQLNPHFLFNSLNAVATLVLEQNVAGASRMLTQIAEVLRTTLDDGLLLEVSLEQEVAFIERYLAIEQIRLGKRLQVQLDIEADTRAALVPSLLLQPLVENAVRHGVARLVGPGQVAIHSELSDARLKITVRNSGGVRQSERSRGIGLANTTERLRTLYGEDQSLTLKWPEEGGCEVTVELPLRRAPEHLERPVCAP